jgi:FAD/FMN-containing dehydrogenase
VTRADLRLVSQPRSYGTALVACPDFDSVARLLTTLDARLGGQLSAFEVMWPEFYEVTTSAPAINVPILPYGLGMYVLIEAHGADPDTDTERLEQALGAAMEAGLVVDAAIAKSDLERRAMWAPREDVFQTRRFGPNHNFDVSMAIADMPGYLGILRRGLAERVPGSRLFVFGHVADGNLQHEATFETVERCVYEPLRSIAGSISAEHGIGLERKAYLEISRSAAEIATMRALKTALDPRGILNPGKIFDVQSA